MDKKEMSQEAFNLIMNNISLNADEKLYIIFDEYKEQIPSNLKYALLEWKDAHVKDISNAINIKRLKDFIKEIYTPMKKETKEEFSRLKWWATKYTGELTEEQKKLIEYRSIFLSLCGEEVCLDNIDEKTLYSIKRYGKLYWGSVESAKMGTDNPYSNCNSFYNKINKSVDIYFGFALGKDGVWRNHCWILNSGTVIETTNDNKLAYYGIILKKGNR